MICSLFLFQETTIYWINQCRPHTGRGAIDGQHADHHLMIYNIADIRNLLYSLRAMETKHQFLDDNDLIFLLKEGDSIAYRELYDRHWEKLYNSVYKRLKDKDQAKDITQDIFLQLWLKKDTLNIENLQAYLFTAGKYSVFRYMEKQQKFVPVEDLLLTIKQSADHADANLLMNEFLKAWEALISSLPEAQQLIFRMRYQQDLSPIEIAKELNISIKTVRNQLGKALNKLRPSFIILLVLTSLLNRWLD